MSLRPANDVLSTSFPFAPTLAHYHALWRGRFTDSFVNSPIVSLSSTLLALALAHRPPMQLERATQAPAERLHSDPGHPDGAADRFHDPAVPAFRFVELHDTRTGLILIYLTFNLAL